MAVLLSLSFINGNFLYSYGAPELTEDKTESYTEGEVLILCDKETADEELLAIAEENDAKNIEIISRTDIAVLASVEIPESVSVETAVLQYEHEDEVIAACPDYVLELFSGETTGELNDTEWGKQEYLQKTDAVRGWKVLQRAPHEKVKVAVLDTGVDLEHPDLKHVLNVEDSCEILDEKGTIGPLLGDGYVRGEYLESGGGHGTQVCGIIAAEANNHFGIAGVGSGGDNSVIDLMVIDIFSKTSTTSLKYLIAGMLYAQEKGAKVLNLSLGMKYGTVDDTLLRRVCDRLKDAGIIVVTAAGNYKLEDTGELSVVPSDYDSTISVIALDEHNNRNETSCYGLRKDICVPGKSIYSTQKQGGYDRINGTSAAAPQVTAAAAMVCAIKPDMDVIELKELLRISATDIGEPGFDAQTVNGLLNIRRLLEEAAGWEIFVQELPYTDMSKADWYYDAASYLYTYDIMTGLTKESFAAGENLKRAQFAVMLYRLEGEPILDKGEEERETADSSHGSKFADVPDGVFYTKAVQWAADAEIIQGYDTGLFGPFDDITREQIATILYRYMQYKCYTQTTGDVSVFPDKNSITPFAKEAMSWAVGNRIIQGNQGYLEPVNFANRAECAVMVQRFMKKY